MHDRRGLFITGTDTNIGKTYIAKLLADCIGTTKKVTCMKPVQTGCSKGDDETLRAPDFDTLISGRAVMIGRYEEHVPYRYEPACSPHLAARLAGESICPDHISRCFSTLASHADVTIVEGAGGILTPLAETLFMIDLIVRLHLPVVLVTSPRLGTLNHTFLTLRLLHESNIRIAGIVVNNCGNDDPASAIYRENLRMIEAHTHPVPFLEQPFGITEPQPLQEFCNALLARC